MQDTITAVLVISGVMIGLPVLILKTMDRGGALPALLTRVLGLIALLLGSAILAFGLSELFITKDLRSFLLSVHACHLPCLMIGAGLLWIRGKREGPQEQDYEDSDM